ncbi:MULTISPECIES: response regulator [Thalassospira]|jgi:two-component system alkaline phosphatase synthesis response regulator PhoP|uniref:response regulator transcription factor n=2 Tax=Thalassospira sp. TaxID=1912094 RepID=UPI0007AD70BE|nr:MULTISPECIES: response regulator [Thalassospira]MEE3045685.1 response regulator [Pseudomonadota bacterium]RCK25983.1 chemotaxis protein CheY [Thalassospira profundimaris]KZB70008.1 two-component system response regulator [Thalassospira sp. MCCC 1A02491]MCC4239229.1 response regulator [Thalassospira povalilytica]URK19908.1 response regulator [Thalassospira sp. GO-4]|tara:strand:+ start:779 stop:1168 length:390 start_codon:yes stop_codon:yes gene_type:complete
MSLNERPKVLIAEDEETIVESLSFLMEKEGYDVRVATDGQTAISMIARDAPDMVLLDVMMPGCDGFEVVRAVRSDANTKLIPIMMLTAKTREVDRRKGLELGVDDFVTKPFSTRDVVSRVRALLERADN